MKVAKFRDHIFTAEILLTFGSMKEVSDYLEKTEKVVSDLHPQWGAYSGKLPSGKHHLHFEEYGFKAIVHETNHATLDILNDRGIVITQATKEVFAYYQDWLAGKCRDYLEKWTSKKPTIRKKRRVECKQLKLNVNTNVN